MATEAAEAPAEEEEEAGGAAGEEGMHWGKTGGQHAADMKTQRGPVL